jgi:protoheme IX farnesyltransferase
LDHVQALLPHALRRWQNYLLVAKPGIVLANAVTAAGGFLLASRGRPDPALLLPSLIGISLAVASGCAFNNYVDRDLDRKMDRTRNRVLPRELISPGASAGYASLLFIAGMIILGRASGAPAAAIVAAGFAVYVTLYSLCLKRVSAYGVLVGSLAGAAPPLAGYCAAAGRLDAGAAILLAIFCLWQVPHAYAVAVFRSDDYAAASIPVLPVRQGTRGVRKRIACCVALFVGVVPMLTFAGYTGYGYLAVTAASGLSWLCAALFGCKASDDRLWARRQFIFSLLNVCAVSVMMSIDFAHPA